MAIYHFKGTVISRSQGRNTLAASAYRAAAKLHDERQDITHDYTKKQDVAHSELLLPNNAPNWMSDREKLWNAVEAAEKRKDSQLAREFNFSLPKELTLEQNILLAREFVQHQFVSKGMVADLAVHNDVSPTNGERQPHAHVMLTFREVTPEGFGQKVRAWNAKENLLQWREAWAETANRHLFLHGHDMKIDHRTLEAQGIDLEPQYKIGSAVAQQRLARLADHQRIARENGEKLLKEPEIALTAITRQQSTFMHHDLARFVNRHTVDTEQFQAVYNTIKASDALVLLGLDSQGRERFTTQEMLNLERAMLTKAEHLANTKGHGVSPVAVHSVLSNRSLSDEQKMAFEHLVGEGSLKNVVGYAGSGKSYLLGAACSAWEAEGYRVHGVALSGIAAENLEAGSGIVSRTIASRCYYWNKGEQLLTHNDVLVVDEAGMIGSRQLNRLLEEVQKSGAKIVLVGDPYQLQAIDAGAAYRAIAERTPTVSLTEIRRQAVPWQREATVLLATGKTDAALGRYARHNHLHAFETQAIAKKGLIELWNDVRLNEPHKTQIVLAYTRDDVREFNTLARELRQQQGELGPDHVFTTARGERSFAERDRVYFLENNRELGVKNGTLGTIERIQGTTLTVRLDKSTDKTKPTMTVDLKNYNQIDHGYAATIHKSQGVTVDRAYVLASKYLDSHATYVGLSRHRDSVDIFYGRDEFAHERALTRTLGRERSKDVTLDYGTQRGLASSVTPQHPLAVRTQSNAFTDTPTLAVQQRYEKLLQQAAKQANARENYSSNITSGRADFSEFKKQFELARPEQAKTLQESVRSPHEKRALEAEKHMELLEKACSQSKTPRSSQADLGRYAASISKQKEVMDYLKQHNPQLSDKIQTLSKEHERTRELSRGRER